MNLSFQKEIFRNGAVALWLERRFMTVCVMSVTPTRVPSYDIDRWSISHFHKVGLTTMRLYGCRILKRLTAQVRPKFIAKLSTVSNVKNNHQILFQLSFREKCKFFSERLLSKKTSK